MRHFMALAFALMTLGSSALAAESPKEFRGWADKRLQAIGAADSKKAWREREEIRGEIEDIREDFEKLRRGVDRR